MFLADLDDVVAGRLRVGGAEAGVDRVQAAVLEGDGGRNVEVGIGEGGHHPAPVERPVELDHVDLVQLVPDHEQHPPYQQQAVAVGQAGPAQVDLAGHAGAGVDPEQQAGVGLHGQQHPAAAVGGDAVEVEPGGVDEVAGQGQDPDLALAGQPAAPAERHDVQLLVQRVGEVGGLVGHGHVVDEGGGGAL